MGLIELFVIGVGLSMDAFAVAICKGLGMAKINWKQALLIALFFGVFQAGMPLIGWFVGSLFASSITAIDHWIAFALLLFVGGKMLYETFTGDEDECENCGKAQLDLKELTMLAVATSIDALAVGISFAFLGVNIVIAAVIIGVTTFVLSFLGVVVGNVFGSRFEKPATIVGGVVLILLGVKILAEHLLGQ